MRIELFTQSSAATVSGRKAVSKDTVLRATLPKRTDNRKGDRHYSRKGSNKPVIFVDGEGANVGEPIPYNGKLYQQQNYALLTATYSDGKYSRIIGDNGVGRLSTVACLRFLLDLPSTHIIIGYGIDYDVQQILYDLPEAYLLRLHKHGYVRWHQFCITYKPRKSFSVSYAKKSARQNSGSTRQVQRPTQVTTWWDIAGFFQTRFDVACEQWKVISPEDYAFMARMKDKRSQFAGIDDEQIEYNKLEGTHGCRVFASVRNEWVELGLPVRRYDGAGAIAAAMFQRNRVDDYIRQSNPISAETMLRAYLGGRFDFSRQGIVGDAHEYDINSAYPNIARNLPCLTHSEWRHVSGDEYISSEYSLWRVRWNTPNGLWAPFPFRTRKGRIGYYANGEGWYYGNEVQAALSLYPSIQIIEGFILNRHCNHRPFNWIEGYYEKRQQLKQAGSFGEKVLKLGLNSVYGKTAQSKGHTPKYQCLIWAGMITSGTRAMILDALRQNPGAAVVTATDAVITTDTLDLPTEQLGLGWWEHKALRELAIVGNGLYQDIDGHKAGSRGFDKKSLNWDYIRERFAAGDTKFSVTVPNNSFFGYFPASIQKRWDLRCSWERGNKIMEVCVPDWKVERDGWLWPTSNPDAAASYPARISPESLRLDQPDGAGLCDINSADS